MNPKVDRYFLDGCMQCKLGATPACKIHNWQEELHFLRNLILECGLTEDFKWMHPCYTFENKNIVLMHVFNGYGALLFPKGVLLKDEDSILVQQTENSQTARQLRFTRLDEIVQLKDTIKAYIFEAIELEKAGVKVKLKSTDDFVNPDELQDKFDEFPGFKKAFYSLTPGRQRGYILHFSQPKQSATRTSRIEKYLSKIFDGKGVND
jgi:uncharacterized protein YdeI (YjbR/CyaY-like superfamily)